MAPTHRRGTRRLRIGPASILVTIVALGIGGGTAHGDSTASGAGPASSLAAALSEAEEAGAADAQIAALRDAVSEGAVTIDLVREAARRAVTCMTERGIEAQVTGSTLSHGLVLPGYTADPRGDAAAGAQVERCDSREHFWVGKAYQLQPSSVEAMERHVESRAPAIRACLEEHGVPTEGVRSGSALADLASRAMHDSIGVGCLAEAGVNAW